MTSLEGRSRLLVRVALLIGAVMFLWLAARQYSARREPSSVGFGVRSESIWYTALVFVLAAAFCFTLAAFLPAGRITLRLPASGFAVVPILGIAHLSAWLHGWWDRSVPRVLTYSRFYTDVEIQTILAALAGVAFASAIRGWEDVRGSG
jgi:hypothetical protein